MVQAGTRTVVATPHIDHHWPVRPTDVGPAVERLNAELAAEAIPLEVLAGGEIALPRLTQLGSDELDLLTLGSSRTLLLESPLSPIAREFDGLIHETLDAGYGVLLAHPERCPAYRRDPGRIAALAEAGVRCQVTASAVAGRFGSDVGAFCVELLRDGLVTVFASDAHSIMRRRPPLREPLASLPGLLDHADYFLREAPAAILADEAVPAAPDLRVAVQRLRAG